ncbi:MAG: sulfite exporter TauE/SafE family protein [Acidimicrobiia bacterium]
MSDPVVVVLVLVAGFFTGVLSGMFGVGGAVISTPAVLLLGATPLQAVGSTLPSIIPGAVSGTHRYATEGLVDRRIAWRTGLAGMAFAAVGAVVSDVIPGRGHVQMVLTAGLMAFTAYRIGTDTEREVPLAHHEMRTDWPLLIVIGALAGMLSGFLGVGGGILIVPAFTGWVGLPLKGAIATSLVCVGMICVPGSIAHQLLGNIDWLFAIPLIVSAVPGARVGAHLAIRASDRTLRLTVASVLGVIAVVYGTVELIQLVR